MVNLAVKIAGTSSHKQRFGVVIAKGNRVLAKGINSYKTHPMSNTPFKTTHAEFRALQGASNRLIGASLYVVRLLAQGTLGMAKPCPDCMKLLRSSKIRKVIYSTESGFVEELLSPSNLS